MEFNVNVKSEPKGAVKGVLKCEVHEEGLTLRKGRRQAIEIPVGSKAKYLNKNQFKVKADGNVLQITVAKFGCYQARLAEDLVDYLKGEVGLPVMSDFSIPWYLYVLSVLPAGIPIMTLGGAIPGAIGFGLVAVCFNIAQQEE